MNDTPVSKLSRLSNDRPSGRRKVERLLRPCRNDRRGAALVEFAVVAPILFLLVFGMIEYGRMVMVQQIITNGAREGARLGVLDGTSTGDVTTAVNDYLANASVSGANVTVTPSPPSSAGYGEPVTVEVSVPFDQVSWLPTPLFIGGKTLTATTVMRRETSQ